MERYLGCDPHSNSCTFSALNASGKQLRRDVVPTNGRSLIHYVKGIPGNVHLCIEEGEWSQWLHEILSSHVTELVVYRPRWRPGSKNDAIDAHGLAEKLRTGSTGCPVYKVAKSFVPLREATRAYTMITRDVARIKSRIKSFYRSRGVSCPGNQVYTTVGRGRLASSVPTATRRAVELLAQELSDLLVLKQEAEKRMLRESRRHRITRILETGPGMGPVRVAQTVSVVGTPYRFRTKRQFWSYCGFGIVTRSSSDWVQENGRWIKARVAQTRGRQEIGVRLERPVRGRGLLPARSAGRPPVSCGAASLSGSADGLQAEVKSANETGYPGGGWYAVSAAETSPKL